jgi:hypothetical protein
MHQHLVLLTHCSMLQTDLVETRQRLLRLVEGPPGSGEQEEQPEQAAGQAQSQQGGSQQEGGGEEQPEVDDDELMQMHAEAMMVRAGLPVPAWLRCCAALLMPAPCM